MKISQPEKGYRFTTDAFILASTVQPAGTEKVVDIGCGCGIISMLLAFKYPGLRITGVEIQKELSDFAQQNISDNRLANCVNIIHDNIKNIDVADINGPADIIISNPPHKKKNSGRLNPDAQKAIARHELCLDIDLLFDCSQKLLHSQGRIYIILPALRLPELLQTMAHHEFTPDFITYVNTQKNAPPKRLVMCGKRKP